MSNGCLNRNTGRSKTASGILVYLNEELGDARLRAVQLKQYVAKALELVEKSNQRDHLFEVAGHIIHGMPDVLLKLEKALEAAAMAASRMDYEEIKQGLRPEKAEELERVLEDVRLQYLKRRSSDMSTYGRSMWANDEDVMAGAGADFQKQNPKITDEEAAEIDEMHEKNKNVVKDKTAAGGKVELISIHANVKDGAIVNFGYVMGGQKGYSIKSIGDVLKAVNHFLPHEVDSLKLQLTRGSLKLATYKNVVKDKSASGHAAEGLEDACWEGYEAYGMKPGEGGKMVPNCVPMKSAAWKQEAVRVARLHPRQEGILKRYLSAHSDPIMFFDELPKNVQQALRDVKASERLAMDVDRWLSDHTFSQAKFASSHEAEEEKAARFEKGVPADPTENMSEEDAAEWKAMTEEHKDQFKTAADTQEMYAVWPDSNREVQAIRDQYSKELAAYRQEVSNNKSRRMKGQAAKPLVKPPMPMFPFAFDKAGEYLGLVLSGDVPDGAVILWGVNATSAEKNKIKKVPNGSRSVMATSKHGMASTDPWKV